MTESFALAYLAKRQGALVVTSWDGSEVLGPARITATWRAPSKTYQVVATINGRCYTGRCAGVNMRWKGRRTKAPHAALTRGS